MTLAPAARRLAKLLAQAGVRVVFAESCTAGLVSASLAKVPGISEHHCGSAVTYRNDSKRRWLGVSAKLLDRPGPVSKVVACEMAKGILRKTPEADWAASVTGHLGPNAPPRSDGVVYVGIARRKRTARGRPITIVVDAKMHRLTTTGREARQREAAELVLVLLRAAIEAQSDA
jgi:PncC family amidohydrolase